MAQPIQVPNYNKEAGRKPNIMEKKGLVTQEQNEPLQKPKDKKELEDVKTTAPSKEIENKNEFFEDLEVQYGGKKKPKKAEAVKSAPPKK